jgi:glycosyltransferase involved in cell wall biosynthesis
LSGTDKERTRLTAAPDLIVLLRGDGTEADRQRSVEALKTTTPGLEVCFVDLAEKIAFRKPPPGSARRILLVQDAGSGAIDDRLAWTALEQVPGADLVLLEVGVIVGPNWEENMRGAAYQDTVIATASALPADTLVLSDRSTVSPGGVTIHPTRGAALGEPIWGCVYMRGDAVKIALRTRGRSEGEHGVRPPRLEELIVVPGLVHVLASTVVVSPSEKADLGHRPPRTPAVSRALAQIEAAVEPLRVLIDMRCCVYPLSGTQVHALNLVSRLAARDDLCVSILLPLRADKSVRPHLEAIPEVVARYSEGQRIDPPPQVFHRPYQLFEGQVNDFVTSGARLVLTHQDMILDRTPAYFRSADGWRTYSAATALSFVAADEVVFYSEHARQEAISDGLLDPSKTSVVPPGTDHLDGSSEGVRPTAMSALMSGEETPFLLFIGNNYAHKNRLFALRVADELERRHRWHGALVSVGGRTRDGASLADEGIFWRDREQLKQRFLDLGRVTDAELQWLYSHAALVLFPTLYEGFGLIPFEAAAAGTPSVYSARSSVGEYLPSEGALLDLGDVAETARRVQRVLRQEDFSEGIVDAIRRVGTSLTWSRAADSYVNVYRRAIARPVGLSLVLGGEIGVGARSEMASTEVEHRMLLAFRRSAGLRRMAESALTFVLAARRALRSR